VDLVLGEKKELEIILTSEDADYGTFNITSSPTDAAIWIDGADSGRLTNNGVEVEGDESHDVTLKLDGYADRVVSGVEVVAGQTRDIHVEFEGFEETGSVNVRSTPSYAKIFVKEADDTEPKDTGRITGVGGEIQLDPGLIDIILKKVGSVDYSFNNVLIVAGETIEFHANLEEAYTTGSMRVRSTPSNASITISKQAAIATGGGG